MFFNNYSWFHMKLIIQLKTTAKRKQSFVNQYSTVLDFQNTYERMI